MSGPFLPPNPWPVNFTEEDAHKAADEWGFNCGPAALCAVTGRTPKEIRAHMGDFERKGYTNPTLMKQALASLRKEYTLVMECTGPHKPAAFVWPRFGLVRIQWAGPWTKPGVPMRARYRATHWIAMHGTHIFDVNAMCVGGWIPYAEWSEKLVPWLLKEVLPRADGDWWPTHCWGIDTSAWGIP